MTRYFCTYFDRNYLTRGLALLESLSKHCEEDFRLYVVCMDEFSRIVLEKIAHPKVVAIPFHTIEWRDETLLDCKWSRDPVEYLWTSTPTIILRLLERFPEIDVLAYVDADLYFFSSPTAVFEELGNDDILIHDHCFPERLRHLEVHGKYNVGLMCFRNNDNGRGVLAWWRDRCLEWCFKRLEDGKFGDQAYLNDWPTRFSKVRVSQNKGIGVAPWNHEMYVLKESPTSIPEVDGVPIVFYHFHSLKILHPGIILPILGNVYPLTFEVAKYCFEPYLEALQRSYQQCQAIDPSFSFGVMQNEVVLEAYHSLFVRTELRPEIDQIGLSQSIQALNPEWLMYTPTPLSSHIEPH